MRVSLPMYGSCGDVEPPADPRCGCGNSVRRCGYARRRTVRRMLARVGVPLVPIGVCR